MIAPRLREYGAPPQHPAACTLSLGGLLQLETAHAVAELGHRATVPNEPGYGEEP